METQTTPPQMPVAAQPQATAFVFPKSREILKNSWELYKARFWTLLGISLLPFAIFLAGGFIAGFLSFFINTSAPLIVLLVFLALALAIYISIWSFAATIRNILSEQPISFGESFKLASHDIWPLFLTGLLVGLAIFGGILLLIVPGIIFSFWFGLSQYVVIDEKLSGVEAMKKSKAYMKGNIGEVFKKAFYLALVTFGLGLLCLIPLGIVGAMVKSQIPVNIGQNIFNIIISPLATIYSFMIYRYAKASKQQPTV